MPAGIPYSELDAPRPAGKQPAADHPAGGSPLGQVVESDGSGGIQLADRYGQELYTFEQYAEATSTVNAPTFTTFISESTPNLSAGKYKISWRYVVSHSSSSSQYAVLVELTGLDAQALNNPNSPGWAQGQCQTAGDAKEHSGFRYVDLIAGIHDIALRFARSSSPGTVTMRGATIEILRVGP